MKITVLTEFSCLIMLILSASLYSPVHSAGVRVYTWKDCLKKALADNPGLRSSRESVVQMKAARGIAGSELYPQISADASVDKSEDQSDSNTGVRNTYSYSITARQLIFDGFKTSYDLKSARSDIETARHNYYSDSASLRLDLRKAFIDLLKAEAMEQILEENKKRRKHIMDLVRMKYEAGTEHRGSYLSARADYLQAIADIESARRAASLSGRTLASLMGISEPAGLSVKGSLNMTEKYKSMPDFNLLVLKNPDYMQALSSVKSALFSLKSSKLAFTPRIYGTASAGRSGDSHDSMSGNWSAGFEISAPLFEGGTTWHSYKKSESAYRQSICNEQSTKNEIMNELEKSWNDLRDSIENLEVQKALLTAALERSKIGEARYSIGSLDFDNWTIIESSLSDAKKSYLEARAAALNAEAQWIKSAGGRAENEINK